MAFSSVVLWGVKEPEAFLAIQCQLGSGPLQQSKPNYYAILGLDRHCTDAQVRDAYRLLAKQQHPDLNHGSRESVAQTQLLNAAYETLSDADRRHAYDQELNTKPKSVGRSTKATARITQDVHLRIEEFFRATTLEVHLNDPANPDGRECYPLEIPPNTAPGTRFRVPRTESSGVITVRVKARPDFRFKVRGSDLRCDLRINARRAAQGGSESVRGATGNFVRVQIPPGVARGEVIRIEGEGLPKSRGGRGDLLVQIVYTPEVRITRASTR